MHTYIHTYMHTYTLFTKLIKFKYISFQNVVILYSQMLFFGEILNKTSKKLYMYKLIIRLYRNLIFHVFISALVIPKKYLNEYLYVGASSPAY